MLKFKNITAMKQSDRNLIFIFNIKILLLMFLNAHNYYYHPYQSNCSVNYFIILDIGKFRYKGGNGNWYSDIVIFYHYFTKI